jgi:hypothetical protein
MLKAKGAKIKKISIPLLKFSLPFHSSNLARFDGLKYGHQPPFPEKGSEDDLTSYME